MKPATTESDCRCVSVGQIARAWALSVEVHRGTANAIVAAAAVQPGRTPGDLMLFHVDMDRVRPIPAVLELPLFQTVLLHGETTCIAVEQAAIYGPLAVPALVKIEVSRDTRRTSDTGQSVKDHVRGWDHAGIVHERPVDDNLEH